MNARIDPDTLPWSPEAEQSVLGGLLIDAGAFDRVGDLLTPGMFFDGSNGAIFAAISSLALRSKPADPVTCFEVLRDTGKDTQFFGDGGCLSYLTALAQSVPSAANAKRYAEVVLEKAAQRDLIRAADEALTLANAKGPVGDKLDRIASMFGRLERASMRKEPAPLSGLLLRAVDRYSELAEGKALPAIATGIVPLDRLLNGGLRPGKVYGIAARPSIGKSSAARAIAISAARAGKPVLLLSQEMPQDEVADCLIAELGGIDGSHLQTGHLTQDEWSRLTEAVDEGSRLPLWVDEEGALTLGDIRVKARGIKGLKVLMLDYLQLCSSTLRGASTNDQVAEISKGLKALAMELGIPVVVLSQLNRDVEKRADREPQLSDLRDSGAIEQDLDVAVMLWMVRDQGDSRLVGWKVAKHRGGPKGAFGMRFDAPRYRWLQTAEPIFPDRKGGDL